MKLRRMKSFTAIETLLATALILLIAVVFFSSFVTSFSYLKRVMELRTASLILQEEVSLVRELPFGSIETLGGTFTSSSMSLLKDAAGSITKSYYGGQDKMIKITFRINWTAFDARPASKTIVTIMTDHGINQK